MKITRIKIRGFKKFVSLDVHFNDHFSVLVGENEVGKSTVLKAIDIVLNQSSFLYNDSSASGYINSELAEEFFKNKTKEFLPKIEVELFLDLDGNIKSFDFDGLHYNDASESTTGIRFVYEFNPEFEDDIDLEGFASNKIVPTEYYKATWNTFQGKNYVRRMSPIKFIYLDNSTIKHDIFGGYARQIFDAKIEEKAQRKISSDFKKAISKFREEHDDDLKIGVDQKIGLDSSKTDIVKLLDIFESGISIQDMGKGRENIVRTEMAVNNNVFDLVLIDEPESHLSYTNTRKLIDMIRNVTQGQVVIASHSSLVVNKLNLQNTIILSEQKSHSLTDLSTETAKYFEKIDNLDVLRFILAEKVLLVEGAAEYIILPKLFKTVTEMEMDSLGIDVISMGSISFKKYKELSDILKKKVVVITDNDKKEGTDYSVSENFKVCADKSTDNWTLEVAFYNANKGYFDNIYQKRKTKPEYHEVKMDKALAHMLKNKTENALEIEKALDELTIPEYLKEAIEWISK
ncbi:AAA family ATPase [Bacillus haynesii]|uniref:ATP-dependent nuclease n=1 Tax=Bacillus haynesii TaxID=1925021 RepID=UPI001592DE53|nr:AAA family ATPase [Bacillus haynesii]MCY7778425.1 AAA family ATPase [Bacillus haynesii]MEC0669376.1 AAA family ATPase [Bacillus haynesii]MEC1466950.1 AAA family ATPase [Bacillus haynesii]NVB32575.1 AAA family ATPase [Bacillus licheniformis]